MEEALVTRLQLAAGVALFADDRVAWFRLPRGWAGPAVLMTKLSQGREYTHAGPDGLDGPTVQFDCLADDPATAIALDRAVRAEMEREATCEGVRFFPGFQLGETFDDQGEQDGGGSLYRVSTDFQFYFEEI